MCFYISKIQVSQINELSALKSNDLLLPIIYNEKQHLSFLFVTTENEKWSKFRTPLGNFELSFLKYLSFLFLS